MVKELRAAQEIGGHAASPTKTAEAITEFAEEIKDQIDKCCKKAVENELAK